MAKDTKQDALCAPGYPYGLARPRRARRALVVALAAAAAMAQPAIGGLTHRYSFTADANDSVGTAHGTLANGAAVTGGQLTLINSGTSNNVITGQYLDLPNNIARTTNVTIEGWTTFGGGGVWQRIFDFGTNNGVGGEQVPGSTATGYNGTDYFFVSPQTGRNGNVFGSELKIGATANVADHVGGGDIGIAVEHHFALVLKGGAGGSMSLYKDGALVAGAATALDPAAINQLNTWIGRSNWQGDSFYNGFVNEFRIYDTAQTAAQIAQSFNAGVDALPGAQTINKWARLPAAGPGDFNEPTNWQLGVLPVAGDIALFDNGGEAAISADTALLVDVQLQRGAVTVTGSGGAAIFAPASIDLRPGSVVGQFATVNVLTGGTLSLGALTLDGAATSTGTSAKAITLDGGTFQATAGFSAVGSAFTLNVGAAGGTIDTNGQNVTLGAALTGTGTLIKAGGGTLTYVYPSANTTDLTTGRGLTINGGVFAVNTNGGNVTWAGTVGGTAGSLRKIGSGQLTLQGAQTRTNLFVNQGSLVLDGAAAVVNTTNYSSFGEAAGDNGRLVVQNGAKLTVNGDFNVSDLTGSAGTLVISGNGTTVTASTVFVGKNGNASGVINQSGGTVNRTAGGADWRIGGPFNTANDAASVGVWDLSGNAVMTTPSHVQIGAFARGIMTISGTASATSGGFPGVGRFPGSFGVLTVTGGSFNQTGTGQFLLIGEEGTGVLNVSGTGVLNAGNTDGNTGLRLGHNKSGAGAAATGVANLGVGGTINARAVTRNAASAGTVGILNFHGGTLKPTAANTNFIQNLTGAYVWSEGGTIDTSAGNVTISQALLAPAGQGVITIPVTSGGAGYAGTPLVQLSGGDGVGATGVANVVGGVVTSVTITNPGTGYTMLPTVSIAGGNPTTPAVPGTPALENNVSGGLTKTGTGTLTLAGANTYTGMTTVSAGTLLVSGSLAGGASTGSGSGTLGGAGTIAGPVSILSGGTVSPGASPGTLSTGSLTLASGSITALEIDGTAAGSFDQLAVTGLVSIADGATLTVAVGYAPAVNDSYVVISNDGSDPVAFTSGFAAANGGPIVANSFTAGGSTFLISYAGGDGNDVTLTAVPEPTTVGLLGLLGAGLLGRRRSRRQRAAVLSNR